VLDDCVCVAGVLALAATSVEQAALAAALVVWHGWQQLLWLLSACGVYRLHCCECHTHCV